MIAWEMRIAKEVNISNIEDRQMVDVQIMLEMLDEQKKNAGRKGQNLVGQMMNLADRFNMGGGSQ